MFKENVGNCMTLCVSVLMKYFHPYFILVTILLISQFLTKLTATFATSYFAANKFKNVV